MFRRIRAKIPMFGITRARIPMFGWEGLGQNSHVCKDKLRIPMVGRIRFKFQCLEG